MNTRRNTKTNKTVYRIISIILIWCLSTVSVFAASGSKIATRSVTKDVNQFDERINYEDTEGYTGVLIKDGESSTRVVSGDYIPGVPKVITEYPVNTGTSEPSQTWMYSDGEGYSGQISLVRTQNNPHEEDYGYEEIRNEPRSFTKEHENVVTELFDANGTRIEVTYSWDNSNNHPEILVDEEGYYGYIPKEGYEVVSGPTRTNNLDGTYTIVTVVVGLYAGTLTERKVWVPVTVMVDDYTGFYSGTIYTAASDTRVWEYTQNYKGGAFTQELKELNYGNHGNVTFDGDPVNVISGNFFTTELDLSIPDLGLPVEILRSYNSVDKRSGILGNGWHFSYESTAEENDISGDVRVIYPDGHTAVYEPVIGTNEYTTPPSVFDRLIKNSDGSFSLQQKSKLVNQYGTDGKLLSISDRNGNAVTLSYDQNGNLQTIAGTGGITLNVTCQGGKIKTITDPIGRTVVYTYDISGNLIQVKEAGGGTIVYEYNSYGLESITDQNGKKYIENEYDSFGRVIRQYDEDRNATEYEYDELNWENTCTFISTGKTTRYQYNENMFITKQTYNDGSFEEYTYDQWGNKDSIRDRNGNTTSFTYNSRGNLLTVILPAPYGYTSSFTYDGNDNLLQAITPGGALSTYVYDANSNLESVTTKIDSITNAITNYTYDGYGRVLTITDAENNTSTFEYGNSNQPVKMKDAELNETIYGYDDVNRNIFVTTIYGTTAFEYNDNDKIEKVTDPLGNATRIKYDTLGNLIKLIKPEQYDTNLDDGIGYSYTYDAMDRLVKQIDPLGNILATQYDQEGNKVKEINPNYYSPSTDDGLGMGYEYDTNGRAIRTVNPTGQKGRVVYDPVGNPTKVIDANNYDEDTDDGSGIQFIYNALNQLVETRDTDNNVIKRLVYDEDGRLIKEIDAKGYLSAQNDNDRYGSVYSYNYAGWLTEVREPLKEEGGTVYYRIIRYIYNKTGNLIYEKKSQQYVTLTGEPNSWNTISYTYYRNGKIKTISDSAGAYMEYTYDATGKTIGEKSRINDTTYNTVGYQYDDSGRVEKVWREIDANDLDVEGSGTVQAETLFEYDQNGNVTQMTRPEGYITTFEYDDNDRMVARHEQVSEDQITILNSKASITTSRANYFNGQQFECEVEIDPAVQVQGVNLEVEYDARVYEFKGFTSLVQGILVDGGVTGKVQIRATNIGINVKTALASIQFKVKDNIIAKGYIVINPASSYTDFEGIRNHFSEVTGKATGVGGPDVNEDGEVGSNDFTFVAKSTGTSTGNPGYDDKYDMNQDGIIDGPDLDYISNYLLNDNTAQVLEMARFSEKSTYPEYTASTNTVIRTTRYEYDKVGNLTKEIDCNNRETIYSYDASNRLETVTDKSSNTTRLFYDEVGNVIKEVLPENYNSSQDDGLGTTYVYDAMNRLDMVIDAIGNIVEKNIYDVNGQVIKEIDASGYLSASTDENRYGVEYTYDIGGRVIAIHTPESKLRDEASAAYSYDAMDNVVIFTDGEGNTTAYERDLWGRIMKVTAPNDIDTFYTYDYAGNVTSSIDGNMHATYYRYNSLNKLASITDPLNKTITYKYDKEGRLVHESDRNGQDILFQYNSDNNLSLSSILGNAEQEKYLYYKDGSLMAAANGTGIDLFEYTPDGSIYKKSRNGEEILRYEYSKNGTVTSVTDRTGRSTGYTYDTLGRLETVLNNGSLTATYDYNEDSTLDRISYNNGIQTVYGYDRNKNTTSMNSQNPQGNTINQFTYSYDNNGNQLTSTENGQTTSYSYDELNRLLTANYPGLGLEAFTYDNAGNRLTRVIGEEFTSYMYNAANQMTQSTKNGIITSYSNDYNGNLLSETTSGQSKTYAYDSYNRAIEVVMPDGQYQQNEYDVFGMRVATIENGNRYDFIYDRGSIISEFNGSGSLLSRSILGYGLIAQEDSAGTLSYYLNNAHGDVVNLVNGNGDILNSYLYDAFGNTIGSSEAIPNRFQYAGEQFDAITCQYYLRARYYNPKAGRFTQEDTYRGDGLNLYAYVANNPLRYVDPSGHDKQGTGNTTGLNQNTKSKWLLQFEFEWYKLQADYWNDKVKYYESFDFIDQFGQWLIKNQDTISQIPLIGYSFALGQGLSDIFVPGDYYLKDQEDIDMWSNRMMKSTEITVFSLGALGILGLDGTETSMPEITEKAKNTFSWIKDILNSIFKKGTSKIDLNLKPNVSNEKLKNIVNDLYKGQGGPNTIGNGTTMDAVRNEINTGLPTHGKFHTQKLNDYLNALQRRLRAGDLNNYDKSVVNALIEDINNALKGQ